MISSNPDFYRFLGTVGVTSDFAVQVAYDLLKLMYTKGVEVPGIF